MAIPFRDRTEAGRVLATKVAKYANRPDVQALALPRGGVPVAVEVANALNVPLDVSIVRKLGVPGREELAMGAVASGGVRTLNRDVVNSLRIPRIEIETASAREAEEVSRLERLYRDGRLPPDIRGRTAILIDDGLATGSTMRAAVASLRKLKPAKIVVAVPTAAPSTCDEFRTEVDEIICAETPNPFFAVGAWYKDFSQVTDDQVREMLELHSIANT